MTPKEGLQLAIEKAGSGRRLAGLIGISQPSIVYWQKIERIPAEHCKAVEKATGVKRIDLRKDVFG